MDGHDLSEGTYIQTDWSKYHDIEFGYTHISLTKSHLAFYFHPMIELLINLH